MQDPENQFVEDQGEEAQYPSLRGTCIRHTSRQIDKHKHTDELAVLWMARQFPCPIKSHCLTHLPHFSATEYPGTRSYATTISRYPREITFLRTTA